jgi:glycosyltransferase involved in cell wall biosynthesis
MTDSIQRPLPRVLVIQAVRFNQQTGGGVALSNFFRPWDVDDLAQIHADNNKEPDFSVCQNYFYLSRDFRVRRNQNVLQTLGITGAQIVEWCKAFQPDVIYYQPLQMPNYFSPMVLELKAALNVPLVTHIMDDWPAKVTKRMRENDNDERATFVENLLKRVFQNSEVVLGISKEMNVAFQQRYGVQFSTIQHSINPEEWINLHKDYEHQNTPFRIIYVGKLVPYMQIKSLEDVANVANELTSEGVPTQLIFYGPEFLTGKHGKHIQDISSAQYGGYVSREEFLKILVAADLLVVVANFDEDSVNFIRYSMPAKVPEYMASGASILVYGPGLLPQARYAREDSWAEVVEVRDKAKLKNVIQMLIDSPQRRQELGEHARSLAFERHTSDQMRSKLISHLHQALEIHQKRETKASFMRYHLNQGDAMGDGNTIDVNVWDQLDSAHQRIADFQHNIQYLKHQLDNMLDMQQHLADRLAAQHIGWQQLESVHMSDGKLGLMEHMNIVREMPIVIYQMGKVGSKSVYESLKALGYDNVYHIHRFQAERQAEIVTNQGRVKHIRDAQFLQTIIFERRQLALFICLVREPISRNFSAFWNNYRDFVPDFSGTYQSTEKNIQLYLKKYPHHVPLAWFDEELNRSLDIDIYAHPFPIQQGYQRIATDYGDLLIIKSELEDDGKAQVIGDFLGIERFGLIQANVASDKAYSDAYTDFKTQITLPDTYLDEMLHSKYARHFYNDKERHDIRRRWSS